MPVAPVGVARDGEMALPRTPAEVGWYQFGPRPGDPPAPTVLAAHLDMPGYGIGPIAAVEDLRRATSSSCASGDTTTRYAVTRRPQHPQVHSSTSPPSSPATDLRCSTSSPAGATSTASSAATTATSS